MLKIKLSIIFACVVDLLSTAQKVQSSELSSCISPWIDASILVGRCTLCARYVQVIALLITKCLTIILILLNCICMIIVLLIRDIVKMMLHVFPSLDYSAHSTLLGLHVAIKQGYQAWYLPRMKMVLQFGAS